jgi:hypothetical protein
LKYLGMVFAVTGAIVVLIDQKTSILSVYLVRNLRCRGETEMKKRDVKLTRAEARFLFFQKCLTQDDTPPDLFRKIDLMCAWPRKKEKQK